MCVCVRMNQNLYDLFWFQSKHRMTVDLHQSVSSMQETFNRTHMN